jgi:hypothetical protein
VSRYPLAIHCRLCTEKSTWSRIEGRAMLTIVVSITSRNPAAQTSARISLPWRVDRNEIGVPVVAVLAIGDLHRVGIDRSRNGRTARAPDGHLQSSDSRAA